MTILREDIKLLQSEKLTDATDGGGRMTSLVVQNGVINNLFPDISRLDRTYGRVSLRKAFLSVDSANVDTYYGSHVILTQPPADGQVNVLMFSTRNWSDVRDDAKFRVENYLGAGGRYPGYLYGTQYTGSRIVTILQSTTTDVPDVGSTVVLVEKVNNVVQYTQYVRLIKVTVTLRQFSDDRGNFYFNELALEISDVLANDYHGLTGVARSNTDPTGTILTTVVTDAATYYGVARLAVDATNGDTQIKVDSVYAHIVPSTQAEQPILDITSNADQTVALASTPREVTAGIPVHTLRTGVIEANRGFNFIFNLTPRPAPGTVTVSYRALGKWYTVKDSNLDGGLVGTGGGSVNYITGTLNVTCAALPDINSVVVVSWGHSVTFDNHAAYSEIMPPSYSFALGTDTDIVANTLVLTWLSNSVLKTATSNSAGIISGDAVGVLFPHKGLVYLRPNDNAFPDSGATVHAAYDIGAPVTEIISAGATGHYVDVTTANPITAGTLRVRWNTTMHFSNSSGNNVATSSSFSSSNTSGVVNVSPSIANRVDTSPASISFTGNVATYTPLGSSTGYGAGYVPRQVMMASASGGHY